MRIPDHTCELVERHSVVLPYPDGDRTLAQVLADARSSAEAWADAHGLDIGVVSPLSGEGYNGVAFDVFVGKGALSANQRDPGVLDNWAWSARVEYWRRMLGRYAGGRKGKVLAEAGDGLASVTAINRHGNRVPISNRVVDGDRRAAAQAKVQITGEQLAQAHAEITAHPSPENLTVGADALDAYVAATVELATTDPTYDNGQIAVAALDAQGKALGLYDPDLPADQRPPWARRSEDWDDPNA